LGFGFGSLSGLASCCSSAIQDKERHKLAGLGSKGDRQLRRSNASGKRLEDEAGMRASVRASSAICPGMTSAFYDLGVYDLNRTGAVRGIGGIRQFDLARSPAIACWVDRPSVGHHLAQFPITSP
jgi:hypothetical protein